MNVPAVKHIAGKLAHDLFPSLLELTVIAIVAIVYTLLFNLPIVHLAYNKDFRLLQIIVWSVFSLCAAGGLFLVMSFNRYLFAVSVPVLFGISSLATYVIIQYKIIISYNTIALMFESNIEEIKGFAAIDLLGWVLLHIGIALIFVFIIKRSRFVVPFTGKAVLVMACLMLGFYSYKHKPVWYLSAEIMPFKLVNEAIQYRKHLAQLRTATKNKHDFPVSDFSTGVGDMTVVLIVGESSRPDHYHVNGYARQTSPELERFGVISFTDVHSLYPSTNKAIPVIFSRIEPLSGVPIERSLVTAFSNAGFTTCWLSAQAYIGRCNNMSSIIAGEAETIRFLNMTGDTNYTVWNDGMLMDYLNDEVRCGDRKKLIVIHTIGSHWRYDLHYPDTFRIFRPTCSSIFNPAFIPPQNLVNSYDNSILYTDYIIGQVIERVKEKTSLVFFVSDHGESLGEDGIYLHGFPTYREEQHRVAMFAWASARYLAAYGDRYRILLANRNKQFTHRVLFHTLLEGGGIFSRNIDHTKSLFSARFVEDRQGRREVAGGR